MIPMVRMGDPLSPHGGEVLEGHSDYFDKLAARQGDQVRCKKHGLGTIVEGSSIMDIEGQPVALDGHRCSCGCRLVSTLDTSLMQVEP